jgi:hypothetical protein
VRRWFPVAYAAFIASSRAAPILCADAGLPSKLRPPAHRELDVADRTAMQLDSARSSSVWHLGLTGAGLCLAAGYTVRTEWPGGLARAFGQAIRMRTWIRTLAYGPTSLYIL